MLLEQGIIFVGGAGTRLEKLTQNCPKPLLPISGRPFLDVLLNQLKRYGIRRVILSAGYLSEKVQTYALEASSRLDLDIVVVAEPRALGTAGALRNVVDRADNQFLLMNGDSLFDFNLLDLVEILAAHPDAALAVALRSLEDASRFGVVSVNGARITGFKERGNSSGGLANGGVYLVDREKLGDLPLAGSLERDVMPRLAAAGRVYGRSYTSFFLDIGVPADYAAAEHLVPQSLRRPAVFFDRDGVLNHDFGYVGTRDRFEWTATAIEAVKYVNDAGWFAFLVTNQAGVARGFYQVVDVETLHHSMQLELRALGAHLDDIRFCPYHSDGSVPGFSMTSDWRKPEPGMILDLLKRHPVQKSSSFLVGDSETDMIAAQRAGIRGVRFDGKDLLQTVKTEIGISAY